MAQKKESILKKAAHYEKEGSYERAAELYKKLKMNDKYVEVKFKAARKYKKEGQLIYAIEAFTEAGTSWAYREASSISRSIGNEIWAERYDKKADEIEDAAINNQSQATRTIDNAVSAMMLLSGMGVLYMLFAKQEMMATQGQLLAPPFPNYLIYILPLILIVGGIYFLWKRARRDIIPLSF